MDEDSGEFGGHEPGAPETWRFSIEVARNCEDAFFSATTPRTRKIALRSAVVMSPQPGGAFDILLRLVRFGLGGAVGSGDQYVSWIHDVDFVRAVECLVSSENIEGAINVSSPNPLPNRDFMRELRRAYGATIGLPAPEWLLEIGTRILRTESELVLKSRRVVPSRMLRSGFHFAFPDWPSAAADLVSRWRN
jgi:NAD dependent epimerase/dehydratase family enzyme